MIDLDDVKRVIHFEFEKLCLRRGVKFRWHIDISQSDCGKVIAAALLVDILGTRTRWPSYRVPLTWVDHLQHRAQGDRRWHWRIVYLVMHLWRKNPKMREVLVEQIDTFPYAGYDLRQHEIGDRIRFFRVDHNYTIEDT